MRDGGEDSIALLAVFRFHLSGFAGGSGRGCMQQCCGCAESLCLGGGLFGVNRSMLCFSRHTYHVYSSIHRWQRGMKGLRQRHSKRDSVRWGAVVRMGQGDSDRGHDRRNVWTLGKVVAQVVLCELREGRVCEGGNGEKTQFYIHQSHTVCQLSPVPRQGYPMYALNRRARGAS